MAPDLDGTSIQLLVDGESFAPRSTDPFLLSGDLKWITNLMVIGHELLGGALERAVHTSTIERRARTLRLRQCADIALLIDGHQLNPAEELLYYPFDNEEHPTLILSKALPLNWSSLARHLANPISRLVDSRIGSLEILLLRLAHDNQLQGLEAPSEASIAQAIGCDVQVIRDHMASLRVDVDHLVELLVPLLGYFEGVEFARRFREDANRAGAQFNVWSWVEVNHFRLPVPTAELREICETASDRADLRRRLDLDYGTFNQVLTSLGEPILSNEPELRRLYGVYLNTMRGAVVERLRRHHCADFRDGRDLENYVARKSLAFLPFNAGWILTEEVLDRAVVQQYVSRLLDEILGPDVSVELRSLEHTIVENRKVVRDFATLGLSIVPAWCKKNQRPVPVLWLGSDAQSIVKHLENVGLLDFEALAPESIPSLCRRANCWPPEMPDTLEVSTLDLERKDVEQEQERRRTDQRQQEIAGRTIQFGGAPLDTGDVDFATELRTRVEASISASDAWFTQSRKRVKLLELGERSDTSSGHGPGGGGGRRRARELSEAQRQAVGLAGELLAYHYLCRRHPGYVSEASWIASNRNHFFGDGDGDDGAGYDFLVKTPTANWFYEVKSTLEDSCEFELTANELRVAHSASKDRHFRYRILYVPYVLSPDMWLVLELPNPAGERTRSFFQTIGKGSLRMRFERP